MTGYALTTQKVPAPPALHQPTPTLTGFRLGKDNVLTLLLEQNGLHTVRQLDLTVSEAGMAHYHPSGIGGFTYGWNPEPTYTHLTRNDGTQQTLITYPDIDPFLVRADPALLEKLASDVWPVMNAHPVKRPKAFIREGLHSGPDTNHANAAD